MGTALILRFSVIPPQHNLIDFFHKHAMIASSSLAILRSPVVLHQVAPAATCGAYRATRSYACKPAIRTTGSACLNCAQCKSTTNKNMRRADDVRGNISNQYSTDADGRRVASESGLRGGLLVGVAASYGKPWPPCVTTESEEDVRAVIACGTSLCEETSPHPARRMCGQTRAHLLFPPGRKEQHLHQTQ
ncbi:hypothetical protein PLICRDRAFT_40154 [Plicaturopsis crispa FD-325 SS-3]|nr:hypothetical protein PLICRDRAFT_40154 [Plicaturopsis crispa FD-325 SS-3]